MSNYTQTARLLKSICEGRAPHAILLTGPEGCGAGEIVRRAAAVHCVNEDNTDRLLSCPDYFEFGTEPVPVDDIRELLLSIAKRSFSSRRAVVFLEAHSMNAHAQNALLKTLEEPPGGTLFLLSGQEAGLLHTIRSRCAIIRLGLIDRDETKEKLIESGAPPELASICAWLSEGAPELALSYATAEHEAYINKAAELFFMAIMADKPPYTELSALLDTGFLADKQARSKASKHRPGAKIILAVSLAILREMLNSIYFKDGGADNRIALRAARAAQDFTISEIKGMIDKALSAKMRLNAANPSLALDSFITDIYNI